MTVTEKRRIPAGDRSIDGHVVRTDGAPGPRPAVVVIHEIFGVDAHILDVGRRFADAGYVAIVPDLFPDAIRAQLTPANVRAAMASLAGAPPELRRDPARFAEFARRQPPERRPILEAFAAVTSPPVQGRFALDLRAVAEFARARPDVAPDRVGAVGFCFGGAMAARLATVDPRLRAAVVFYGQNPPLADVPAIRADVLGLYGGEDPGITETVPAFAEAMRAAGRSFDYRVYPGARHAFFNDTRPNYDAAAAADAWPRVLAFLAERLAPP